MARPQMSPADHHAETGSREPWEVFSRTFGTMVPSSEASSDPAVLISGVQRARQEAMRHMLESLRWPLEEAGRIARLMQVELLVWAQRGGFGEENLRIRLQRVQAKVRAEVALGIPAWPLSAAGPPLADPGQSGVRAVRLPPSFYLPRITASGEEVRDVVPWEGAVDYVTDGTRYGVRMKDGVIRWFESAASELAASLREDFGGVDVAGVVEGLKEYAARSDRVSLTLAADIGLMESLLGR
jgi:hypothetical protein